MHGTVFSLAKRATHEFSKTPVPSFRLIAGEGVEGDAHRGTSVQHRSRVRHDPSQPNLRQVHLISAELLDELAAAGFRVAAGDIGENITTLGLDLLSLPTGTRLMLGDNAVIEITGLRNPCMQLDQFQHGLMSALLGRDLNGQLVRKGGVMAIVLEGGEVRTGDQISVVLPDGVHHPLKPV